MIRVHHGEAESLPYPDDHFDCLITDPPYGYGFMGKNWDKAVVGVHIWKEVLRVMKPGAFGFIMSAPRQDVLARMIVNLQEAGFETGFTSIYWAYGTGFPKAMSISRAAEKKMRGFPQGGANPESPNHGKYKSGCSEDNKEGRGFGAGVGHYMAEKGESYQPELLSPQAQALNGSYAGFQPKPAVEVILVVMKPLSERTYLDQAMKDGKGITWMDAGRIPYSSMTDKQVAEGKNRHEDWGSGPRTGEVYGEYKDARENYSAQGRFPANLLVSDDVLDDGAPHPATVDRNLFQGETDKLFGPKGHQRTSRGDTGTFSRYFSLDAWWETRARALLDKIDKFLSLPEVAQRTYPFFIVPKASKAEKNRGCEGMPLHEARYGKNFSSSDKGTMSGSKLPNRNSHPTVKPVKLMSYLIAIGSRPGDLILDPFMGSGSTLVAAKAMGRRAVGVDNDGENIPIAEARVKAVNRGLF